MNAYQIIPLPLKPIQPSFLNGINKNAKYEYHVGVVGYSINHLKRYNKYINNLIKHGNYHLKRKAVNTT